MTSRRVYELLRELFQPFLRPTTLLEILLEVVRIGNTDDINDPRFQPFLRFYHLLALLLHLFYSLKFQPFLRFYKWPSGSR
jgi:hypothetical protein